MWSELCVLLLAITGISGFVDLIHGQTFSASAAMISAPHDPKWIADKAIDRNTNQSYLSNSCAITNVDNQRLTKVWWKVWLQQKFNIAYLEIYFRSDTFGRSSGFSIYTYDTQNFYPFRDPKDFVYRHDPMSGCPSPIQNVTVNYVAQGIVFINERPQGYISNCQGDNRNYTGIEICEVKVMGCEPQKYSSGCGEICSTECENQHCDAFNGSCIHGCSNPNALTVDCILCDDKMYIHNRRCVKCQGHCKNKAPCNKSTGRCDYGCANHWNGPFCQICSPHFYGDDCNIPCGQCRSNAVCDNGTGLCPNGCKGNWQKPHCYKCIHGHYNTNCTEQCGHCKNNETCDQNNGTCPSGCVPHFHAPLCKECEDGFYNDTCTAKCGHCKNNATCYKKNGHCPLNCTGNYEPPLCQECSDGFYGVDCESHCGHCDDGEVCDKRNGTCYHGCLPNFEPDRCTNCSDGHYNASDKCSPECGQCLNGMPCNKESGNCTNGCEPHYIRPLCKECDDGYYGSNCSNKCGQCLNGEPCDKKTGNCTQGCQTHFQPPLCIVCEDGFYNKSCNASCGYCKNKEPCDKQNGNCIGGCENHFQQPLCQECEDGFYNEKCTQKCGQCAKDNVCDKMTGNCSQGCKPNFLSPLCNDCTSQFYGDSCNDTCGQCNKTAPGCDKKDGHCLYGCDIGQWKDNTCHERTKSEKEDQGEELKSGPIVGGVSAAVIVVAVIVLLGFFYRRHLGAKDKDPTRPFQFFSNLGRQGTMENRYGDLTESSPEEHTNEALAGDDGGYYNTAELNTYIKKEELPRVITEKNAGENNVFLVEYKRLPVGDTDKCKAGQRQENIVKNRFKTTFPYDHSRIILKEKWTDNDNDYINANYIKNCNGVKTYIAAQGPKKVTLTDFWRMLWQENIKLIVMLTNIVENGKNKCTQYWPEKDKIMDVGPCKIKLLKEIVYAFHSYRKFTVQNNSNKRTITQFHYTAWPDHDTPEELGLVQFHRTVTKTHQTRELMLVHCSAGVGRTGTFIGLDALLKQGQESGRINVFEFVKQMREDRMTMVQTTDQYVFLHKALLCGFQEKGTVIVENNIPAKVNSLLQDTSPLNQRPLYKEYKLLQTLKPVYNDKDKEDGKKPENSEKNKDIKILPVSKYRPYLTSYVKGRNDYINGVYVPSFTEPNGFILTQYPLKATEVDLWRLCMDHDVHALVLLGDNTEEVSWIPQKGSTNCCTPYSLTSGNTGSSMSGVSENSLVVSIEEQKKELCVFHIPTGNDNAILKGVELLLEKEKQHSFTSVLLSKDGTEAVGIFCVLHNVLQQLRMDKEVDIFTAVRQIHTRRPEVISKLDEYRRCYELLLLSISEDGIYANM